MSEEEGTGSMTLWVLCSHGEKGPHDFDNQWQGVSDCPGGRPATSEDAARFLISESNYTIRCEACEIAGCHVGINGGHDGPDNPPVHTRDVWVLTGLTESEVEG